MIKSNNKTDTVPANRRKKSTEATIFVRFVPPSTRVRRHHLEAVASEIGPLKKSAVISKAETSFAFLKYTTQSDAVVASQRLQGRWLTVPAASAYETSERVQLHVQLASETGGKKQQQHQHAKEEEERTITNKRGTRVIVRNLSFYATAKHVQAALQPFGSIVDVHLPAVVVAENAKSGGSMKPTHRGFGFVTFAKAADAQKCVKAATNSPIVIKKRPVQIAFSLQKDVYQANKKSHDKKTKEHDKDAAIAQEEEAQAVDKDEEQHSDDSDDDDSDDDDDDSSTSSSGSNSSSSSESEHADDAASDDDEEGDQPVAAKDAEQKKKAAATETTSDDVSEHRSLFVRNLPFDAVRHDLFELFRPYGRIAGIYMVVDDTTGIPKGTAFVAYTTAAAANKALQAAAGGETTSTTTSTTSGAFVAGRDAATGSSTTTATTTGLTLKGRRIYCNLAVDKDTASTLTATKKDQANSNANMSKDRRNLYLKTAGRVNNDPDGTGRMDWDALPETDRIKRSTAWSETNTKLRSPLFYINPVRLSIRNLAKHVDETALKQLCAQATMTGLKRGLVTADDQIAHWRASGDYSTRDILAKLQEHDDNDNAAAELWPVFNAKNVKQSIPSVFINRDFVSGSNTKKDTGTSRGFGFCEFTHHAHALACLRQLNNNVQYSADFVAGGRRQQRSKTKGKQDNPAAVTTVPRLIVEFSVENKAKAQQQAQHRAAQQANQQKQKLLHQQQKESSEDHPKKKKKKSRGAQQRERKRKLRQAAEAGDGTSATTDERGHDDNEEEEEQQQVTISSSQQKATAAAKHNTKKPKKKRKVDPEEQNFKTLVDSYKRTFAATTENMSQKDNEEATASSAARKKKKGGARWFD